MSLAIKRLKNKSKHKLQRYPALFVHLYYWLAPQYRDRLVARDTNIVIEGFPRSANTFAYFAFLSAQPQSLKIAHHLHVIPQILMGIRWGIPVLVLMRKPEDAVRSLYIRHPAGNLIIGLKYWCDFYSVVSRHLDKVVVADFDEVINGFGDVVSRVNKKFGTTFVPFTHSSDNVKKVFREIEEFNSHYGENNPMQVNRPDPVREQIYRDFQWPAEANEMLMRANKIYETIISSR